MKQLTDDFLCKYCLGCNLLEMEQFEGVRRCKAFEPMSANWYNIYINNILKRKGKTNEKR